MQWSIIVLALGVLCAPPDQLFGARKWQGDMSTLRKRAAFAWKDRPLTIVGSILALTAIPLEAAGA